MTAALPHHDHYDAIVIGARCAGAATAMLLARNGLRVLAVDRSNYGSDTLSTHALMRPAVLQLARWGLLQRVRDAGTPTVGSTVFHYATEQVELATEPRDGVDGLYSPRRTVLDRILVDAARQAGAEVCHGLQLIGLQRGQSGAVCGVRLRTDGGIQRTLSSDIVIGADGRHSTVARMAQAQTYLTGRFAMATLYGYFEDLKLDESPRNHWYFRPGVGGGHMPTNDGRTLVFVGAPAQAMREDLRDDPHAALRRGVERTCPEILPALADARQVGRLQGFGGQPGFLRQCHGPGWALVGDAGYFKDPTTAHGISDAFRDAELLARAVTQGGSAALGEYQRTRDELSRRLFEVTDEIASCQWTLPEVGELHRQLSREMKRECNALLAFDSAPVRPASVPQPTTAAASA